MVLISFFIWGMQTINLEAISNLCPFYQLTWMLHAQSRLISRVGVMPPGRTRIVFPECWSQREGFAKLSFFTTSGQTKNVFFRGGMTNRFNPKYALLGI